ncbi:CU044_5270 family protein [Actinomadura rugatobispora]|uniref:CU044_5270 family protein n=1 Tax=Actinomadura rugatobispora TaxID=1994 RepID=A0ABW0ZXA0_9ACTN|nr:hypothetical protein GCM10010200_098910 [Actinomadura rugatobispora]
MKPHPTDDLVRAMARVDDASLAGYAGRPAARALLNDVMTVPEPPAVSARRFRLPGLRLAVAAAAALAITAGVGVAGQIGGDAVPPGPVLPEIRLASAAETGRVLDRAAAAAESRPVTAPKAQQWVYTKMRLTTGAKPAGAVAGGPYRTDEWELWRRADGKQFAAYKNGEIEVNHEMVSSVIAARYNPIPTDPAALLRKVGGDRPKGREMAYLTLITLLRDNVYPPATEATIFRAIKLIPGVTLLKDRADAAGRPALALGLTTGWVREEVLLDPRTYSYLGERAIAIKDRTLRSEGEPALQIPKGTLQRLMVRVTTKIVDKPGQRS